VRSRIALGSRGRTCTFLTLLLLIATLAPEARAQQQAQIARLGFLGFGTPAAATTRVEALRAGLRDLGYVEGKNLVIEFRWSRTVEQMHDAAAELARLKVDVIFASSSTEVEPARRATNTIPIVFATHADPVGLGHVASLARPGGNITGLAVMQPDITAKRLEILKETVPQATRFGVLWDRTAPSYRPFLQAAEAARGKLGVQLRTVGVSTVADYDGAFAMMTKDRVGAVLVHASTQTSHDNPRLLADLALKHRLPTMFGSRDNVVAGGLMSYAPDFSDLWRRAAVYIDKILKGAKPAELPVEQASKYQLVINRKTASALDLTIPTSLLHRADEAIERFRTAQHHAPTDCEPPSKKWTTSSADPPRPDSRTPSRLLSRRGL
jgi:putative ABC transport system substrate-binding protein